MRRPRAGSFDRASSAARVSNRAETFPPMGVYSGLAGLAKVIANGTRILFSPSRKTNGTIEVVDAQTSVCPRCDTTVQTATRARAGESSHDAAPQEFPGYRVISHLESSRRR